MQNFSLPAQSLCKKAPKGFTLIEFLVVIGILALSATFIFVGFRTSQTSISLNLAVDSVQNGIWAIQQSAKTPRVNEFVCHGLVFSKRDGIQSVVAPYVAKKWRDSRDIIRDGICDLDSLSDPEPLTLMDSVILDDPAYGGFYLFALPPRGELALVKGDNEYFFFQQIQSVPLHLVFVDDSTESQSLYISLLTGNVERSTK